MEDLTAARKHMGGVRLVTLKGDLIESSGAMVGGSVVKQVSFGVSNREKLEEMREALREATRRQEELTERLLVVRGELSEMGSTTWGEKGLGEGGEVLLVRKKEFEGKLKLVADELVEKEKERDKLQGQLDEVSKRIGEHESRVLELDTIRRERGEKLLGRSKKEDVKFLEVLRQSVEGLREEERNVKGDIGTLVKKMGLVTDREGELVDALGQIEGREKEYSQSMSKLEKAHGDYKEELEALMKVEEKISGKVKEFTQKRDRVYREIVNLENDIDTLSAKIETFHDLISRAKTRLPTLEDTHRELVGETQGYSFDDTEILSLDILKQNIRGMEETLTGLEPVNMRALEEYDRQSERKAKFDEDVSRLQNQRKDLIHLVDEITTKKKDRFNDIFHQINENFKVVYGQLSEGGKAELILDDPDNPFEGGLVIKAKPKGKKVHYLSALSGGEKSMASLAFIFAIQNFDPSPFYILDEVDMFLDGKNAETVARMLKMNSKNAQFIAVTLKKDVLQQANHVYGTVMQDFGVSNMIGNVDISKIEGVK
jgi:chromosome segregation protein